MTLWIPPLYSLSNIKDLALALSLSSVSSWSMLDVVVNVSTGWSDRKCLFPVVFLWTFCWTLSTSHFGHSGFPFTVQSGELRLSPSLTETTKLTVAWETCAAASGNLELYDGTSWNYNDLKHKQQIWRQISSLGTIKNETQHTAVLCSFSGELDAIN